MKKTKLAIFDIDGTLYDGTAGIDLLRELMKRGMFEKSAGKEILQVVKRYAASEIIREEIFDLIHEASGRGIKGVQKEKVEKIAKLTWQKVKDNLFSFSREIIKLANLADYYTIGLSGSSTEMVLELAIDLGIKTAHGATFETKEGVYTGRFLYSPGLPNEKKRIIKEIAKEQNLGVDWENSIAIGDSESEMELFKMVGKPMVFEPHPSFLSIAKGQGWPIYNRDNVLEAFRREIGA